ncbi:MAG: protease modulator HflC [Alistipes senegalensis]|nr:protease modulator HflC [Oxalobacter formigenes]MCM1281264.1 protease modulator HflC [Alistipes senegalensis]
MRRVVYLAGALAAIVIFLSGIFVVDQRQYAIVFALGEVKNVIEDPGFHIKLPAPLQNVVFLDKRILSSETHEPDRIITAEKMNILVDWYVKWRIVDPKLYYVSFGADEQRTQDRLAQIVKASLNDEITKRTLRQVIAGDRDSLMAAIKKKMSDEARQIGIQIVDIRIKRLDYVEQVNNSVYERMKSERTRVANELRSTGAAESEKIQADADRQRTVILAEAYREAEKIRGQGDAKASRIYAQAFGQNPEFYRFYRSLEAYRASFNSKKDVIVVDPSSEFFRYMKSPK